MPSHVVVRYRNLQNRSPPRRGIKRPTPRRRKSNCNFSSERQSSGSGAWCGRIFGTGNGGSFYYNDFDFDDTFYRYDEYERNPFDFPFNKVWASSSPTSSSSSSCSFASDEYGALSKREAPREHSISLKVVLLGMITTLIMIFFVKSSSSSSIVIDSNTIARLNWGNGDLDAGDCAGHRCHGERWGETGKAAVLREYGRGKRRTEIEDRGLAWRIAIAMLDGVDGADFGGRRKWRSIIAEAQRLP